MKKLIIKRVAKPIMVNKIIVAAAVGENLSGKWVVHRFLQNSSYWSKNSSWNGSPYGVFVEWSESVWIDC